jgi:NADH:ubiquinone oxidoreductase subunit 4 (subunit M)
METVYIIESILISVLLIIMFYKHFKDELFAADKYLFYTLISVVIMTITFISHFAYMALTNTIV